jgi:6-phosphofructokinase 1
MEAKDKIKKIGVLTSGGDAPGMNAAIRAVVRAAIFNKKEVVGVKRGYSGLIEGDFVPMQSHSVSKIISMGGTILKSSRCPEFKEYAARQRAYENMQKEGIDALVVIGGDGSLTGARIFAQEYDVPCIGIPATIDNNLCGTDTTIGYDTALNTIVQTVDKIRDTATSHERLFFIEVMGDDAGFLALNGAIAAGCEEAIIPSVAIEEEQLNRLVLNGVRKSKGSSIVLVASNEGEGAAMHYAEIVKNRCPNLDVKISLLGHLQRGGQPTAHDRIIASRMGVASIEALMKGLRNVMIGIDNDEIVYVPFSRVIKETRQIDHNLIDILHNISI